jgi:hypothetical protein
LASYGGGEHPRRDVGNLIKKEWEYEHLWEVITNLDVYGGGGNLLKRWVPLGESIERVEAG